MKNKKVYLNLLLAASCIVLLPACENDAYNPNKKKVENTKNLKAPSNFDWKMTRSTTCTITAPTNTAISVYTDAACTDESLLMENITLTANEAKELTLDIPAYKTSIYVQYPTVDGKKVVEGKVGGAVTRSGDITLVLPDAKDSDGDDYYSYCYYPAKNTQGTLMFEDLYPELGDYDFNDFVIGYNVKVFISRGSERVTNDGFDMTFKIRAMGGSLPYRPALRLKGFANKFLKNATINFTSTRTDINMELVKDRGDDQDVIFIFTGTGALRNGGFFNTEADKAVDSGLPEITCHINRDNFRDYATTTAYNALAVNLPAHFDFFLQNTSTMDEIHFKGFNPTDMSGMSSFTEFVDPESNLVWAIAVPEEIDYPKEKIDILSIFQDNFRLWVTSGGTTNADWYQHPKDASGLFSF